MKFQFSNVVIIGCVLSFGCMLNVANAGIINNGDFTTVDGADWLDMSFTDGKSYNEVLSLIQSGNTLFGWRVASFNEVEAMYRSFGYTETPNDTSDQYYVTNNGYDQVLQHLGSTYNGGTTYAFTVGYVNNIGNNYSSQNTWQQVVQTGAISSNNNGFWRGDSWGNAQSNANSMIGTYLTRGGAVVPEPSTLAIFVLGIMGLASRRFKKQS